MQDDDRTCAQARDDAAYDALDPGALGILGIDVPEEGLMLDPEFHHLEFASRLLRKRWDAHHRLPAVAERVILAASVVALGLAVGAGVLPGRGEYVEWLFRLALPFSLVFGAALLWNMWQSSRR